MGEVFVCAGVFDEGMHSACKQRSPNSPLVTVARRTAHCPSLSQIAKCFDGDEDFCH